MRGDVGGAGHAGEVVVEDKFGDARGDMQRSIEDVALRRIDQAGGEIFVGHLFGDGLGRENEHLLSHPLGLGREHRHAHRRKDIDIVALAGRKTLTAELDRRKGAAAGKDGAAARPAIGFLGRAFRAGSRVRIGKDDRAFVDIRHGLDDGLIKEFRHSADADDRGRPQLLDRVDELIGACSWANGF